ncbi:hypothetical protein MANES_18G125400v8 [Manihot esculenta]|uniref:Uncharacterized protein n=1 Tax=Manihot esculenta TaxID=3983 RepID=A0ACB7G4K2_MANES|nr:hypothetical protein MANES_18G125400v8 [Manihot esculenta]
MASNSSSKSSYDVFLSFRGADTRPNFTSHLYAALNRKNITTFIDDSLERGEDISLTLLKVIEESKISVIIFSENYASSRWCLDELLKILECMKTMGQFVIPIFYHVDPSDVRNQTGNFGEAFAKRKERCKELSIDRVERWSNALREAANLSGWDSSNYRLESELSEEVADQILKKLYPISFSASTGLVGIDLNVKKIISLLCINPTNVQVIGIWGMGGIGKTTIAEVLVSQIFNQFDCFCFLRNVREESEKIGLLGLRSRFFSELSGVEIKIEMLHVLPTFIKDSLKRKKVLVVLDDVNDAEQLDALAVHDDDCFGLGSRIILISRDKQVLSSVDEVYEVKGLDDSDALQLLSMKAFKQKHPPMKYIELSERVQTYCKGVPLALKVLGSYLCKRTPEEWETALNKLKRFPDCNIMKVLKISYDDLDPIEKSIFLDIACFFKGYNKIWVEEILNGFDFPSHWGIIRLMDMCLITIVNNKLEMHDLIVEMGQDIARRKGNRLWNSKDICHILATANKANKAVEGLFLDMSETERVYLNPAVFSRIPNLRLLKFYWSFPWFKKEGSSFIIEHGPSKHIKSLPNKLSLLHWEEYPFKSLPLDRSLENLVHLIMPESKAEELWNGSKSLPKLKSLDLSRSVHLKKLPDFSLMTNLESIKFICCESLIEIPTSIQCLGRLNSLYLSSCKELRSLPSLKQLKFLKNLNLFYCCNLKIFPQIPRGIEEFEVRYSGLEEWSQSILFLDNLNLLRTGHFINLRSVPRIKNYNNNCFLDLIGYLNLITLPEIIGNVESLIFDGTLMEELPSSIGCHSSLVELSLVGCERLKSLPSSICKLELLKRLRLNGCSNLEELPPLYGLCSLRELYLNGTALVESPPDSFSLPLLRRLSLNNCKRLQTAVSASYIPPIKYPEGSWEDYRYVFNFCNCVNLDQTARSNIMADALRKFEELAIAINVSLPFLSLSLPPILRSNSYLFIFLSFYDRFSKKLIKKLHILLLV